MTGNRCLRGHDTTITGRYRNYTCKACMRERRALLPPRVLTPEQIEAKRLWTRQFYRENRETALATSLAWRYRTRYGTTPEEVAQKIEQQGNACAICGTSFTEARPCIDHNHRTITPRAILCQRCNVLVGFLESELAPIAQAYIEAWQEE